MKKHISLFLILVMMLAMVNLPTKAQIIADDVVDNVIVEEEPNGTNYLNVDTAENDAIILNRNEPSKDNEVKVNYIVPQVVNSVYSSGFAYTDNGNETCTITGIGTCADTEVSIPTSIEGLTVNSIGEKAFENQTQIAQISIPETVQSIGRRAFYGCTGLTELTIPSSVSIIGAQIIYKADNIQTVYYNASYYPSTDTENPFLNNAGIKKVVFGGSNIGSYAARNLGIQSKIEEVVILDSVYAVYDNAFYNCSNLTSAIINAKQLNSYAFAKNANLKNVVIGDNVLNIKSYSFQECRSIESVIIGNNVITIGQQAFYECNNLSNITIPYSVKTINQSAFSGCSTLVSVYYSGDLKSWCEIEFASDTSNPCCYGANLYIDNTLLTDVIIPNNLTKIGQYAFYNCKGIVNVSIPDNITTIGQSAFYGCSNLTNVDISNSISFIDCRVFGECRNLSSFIIPDSVSVIKEYAFINCSSLSFIVIPDSVTNIAAGAFDGCSGLVTITIPDSVITIGSSAFGGCANLEEVYFDGTSEQWFSLEIGSYNTSLKNATLHFLNDAIAISLLALYRNSSLYNGYPGKRNAESISILPGDRLFICGWFAGKGKTVDRVVWTLNGSEKECSDDYNNRNDLLDYSIFANAGWTADDFTRAGFGQITTEDGSMMELLGIDTLPIGSYTLSVLGFFSDGSSVVLKDNFQLKVSDSISNSDIICNIDYLWIDVDTIHNDNYPINYRDEARICLTAGQRLYMLGWVLNNETFSCLKEVVTIIDGVEYACEDNYRDREDVAAVFQADPFLGVHAGIGQDTRMLELGGIPELDIGPHSFAIVARFEDYNEVTMKECSLLVFEEGVGPNQGTGFVNHGIGTDSYSIGLWLKDDNNTEYIDFSTYGSFCGISLPAYWASNGNNGALAVCSVEIYEYSNSVAESLLQSALKTESINATGDDGDGVSFEWDEPLPAGRYVIVFTLVNNYYDNGNGTPYFILPKIDNPDTTKFIYSSDPFALAIYGEDINPFFVTIQEEQTVPPTDPNLHVAACNLSFADSIYIKYAISADDLTGIQLLIWTAPQSEYVYGTQNMVLTTIGTQTVSGANCAVFQYDKLAAKQMVDYIYARAYVEIGGTRFYSEVKKYSVLQYAYNKTGRTGTATTDPKLITLLYDMLQYGASAQNYLNYKTGRLATMDYYQVKVVNGVLSDMCDSGLYLTGESVVLTAPTTNAEGLTFVCWQDKDGNVVGTEATLTITVGEVNEVYTAVFDNVIDYSLFEFESNGDGTCMITSLNAHEYTDIVLPDTAQNGDVVTGIDVGAFAGEDITSITIPVSVTSIGKNAFKGCSDLTDVYYGGTPEQWAAIMIANGNDVLTAAEIHYAAGG